MIMTERQQRKKRSLKETAAIEIVLPNSEVTQTRGEASHIEGAFQFSPPFLSFFALSGDSCYIWSANYVIFLALKY